MCKLLIVTATLSRETTLKLLRQTARNFEKTQRDGFGFASFDVNGNPTAWGRYYDTYKGWGKNRKNNKNVIEVGDIPEVVQTLIVHGRTSTNVRGVEYCHPYSLKGTYLAHNGILEWVGPEDQEPDHENDSGAFLEWLVANQHPETNAWTKNWAGYGAMAIMRPGKGLTVTKCERTRLTLTPAARGGYVFATSPDDVPRYLAQRGARPRWLKSGEIIIDENGELAKVRPFKGFKARKWDYRSTRSLGYAPKPQLSKPLPVTKLGRDFDPDNNSYPNQVGYYEQMRLRFSRNPNWDSDRFDEEGSMEN